MLCAQWRFNKKATKNRCISFLGWRSFKGQVVLSKMVAMSLMPSMYPSNFWSRWFLATQTLFFFGIFTPGNSEEDFPKLRNRIFSKWVGSKPPTSCSCPNPFKSPQELRFHLLLPHLSRHFASCLVASGVVGRILPLEWFSFSEAFLNNNSNRQFMYSYSSYIFALSINR